MMEPCTGEQVMWLPRDLIFASQDWPLVLRKRRKATGRCVCVCPGSRVAPQCACTSHEIQAAPYSHGVMRCRAAFCRLAPQLTMAGRVCALLMDASRAGRGRGKVVWRCWLRLGRKQSESSSVWLRRRSADTASRWRTMTNTTATTAVKTRKMMHFGISKMRRQDLNACAPRRSASPRLASCVLPNGKIARRTPRKNTLAYSCAARTVTSCRSSTRL